MIAPPSPPPNEDQQDLTHRSHKNSAYHCICTSSEYGGYQGDSKCTRILSSRFFRLFLLYPLPSPPHGKPAHNESRRQSPFPEPLHKCIMRVCCRHKVDRRPGIVHWTCSQYRVGDDHLQTNPPMLKPSYDAPRSLGLLYERVSCPWTCPKEHVVHSSPQDQRCRLNSKSISNATSEHKTCSSKGDRKRKKCTSRNRRKKQSPPETQNEERKSPNGPPLARKRQHGNCEQRKRPRLVLIKMPNIRKSRYRVAPNLQFWDNKKRSAPHCKV